MCKCKGKRRPGRDFMTEACVKCGRIFVMEFSGGIRSTERFEPISQPMGGVWIGHTFIKDPKGRLSSALKKCGIRSIH